MFLKKKFFQKILISSFFCIQLNSISAENKEPPQEKKINIGVIATQTGDHSLKGKSFLLGLFAALYNKKVSIQEEDFLLNLIAVDENITKKDNEKKIFNLINAKNCLFFTGGIHAVTAKKILPELKKNNIPLFGWLSGDETLYQEGESYFSNYRATYQEEASALLATLSKEEKEQLYVITEDDDIAKTVAEKITTTLEKEKIQAPSKDIIPHNMKNLSNILDHILSKNPKVLFLIANNQPAVAIIQKIRKEKKYHSLKDIKILCISLVIPEFFTEELKKLKVDNFDNIFISQVTAHPQKKNIPFIQKYHDDIQSMCEQNMPLFKSICSHDQKANYVSLEGYILGRTQFEALKKMKKNTSDSFRKSLKDVNVDFGGVKVKFGNYQTFEKVKASERVFITTYQNGIFS